jgi:hypothetical protein
MRANPGLIAEVMDRVRDAAERADRLLALYREQFGPTDCYRTTSQHEIRRLRAAAVDFEAEVARRLVAIETCRPAGIEPPMDDDSSIPPSFPASHELAVLQEDAREKHLNEIESRRGKLVENPGLRPGRAGRHEHSWQPNRRVYRKKP